MSDKKSTVIIRLEVDLKDKLRILAKDDGRPMAGFMAQLLRNYIKENPDKLRDATVNDQKK